MKPVIVKVGDGYAIKTVVDGTPHFLLNTSNQYHDWQPLSDFGQVPKGAIRGAESTVHIFNNITSLYPDKLEETTEEEIRTEFLLKSQSWNGERMYPNSHVTVEDPFGTNSMSTGNLFAGHTHIGVDPVTKPFTYDDLEKIRTELASYSTTTITGRNNG
jgi:hypothetical protein